MNKHSLKEYSLHCPAAASLTAGKICFLAFILTVTVLVAAPANVAAYCVCSNDDSPCTHEVMTVEGFELYLYHTEQLGQNDLADEMVTHWLDIKEGAGIPDEYDPLFNNDLSLVTITHFWDPDYSLGNPMLLPAFNDYYPNAFNVVQGLWVRALGYYVAGNKSEAYQHLGMITHFLGDMTIPAHTHSDVHPTDKFEDWMSKPAVGGGGSPNAMLSFMERILVQSRGILGDVQPEIDDQLLWLFLNTNQVGDYFASDDYDGNLYHPNDPQYPSESLWPIDAMNSVEFSCVNYEPYGCPTTTERLENNDADDEYGGDDDDLILIRKYSYLYGIRAMGALFALWEKAITQPVLIVNVHNIAELPDYDLDYGSDPDFFVGMVMGNNERSCTGDCGDPVGAYLENSIYSYRVIDGELYPSNVTRRDAYNDNEDQTAISPDYHFGQSYTFSEPEYVAGTDVVNMRLYVWDQDPNSIELQPYSDDDIADISQTSTSNLDIEVDLQKCLCGIDDAVTIAGEGVFDCGENITTSGTGEDPAIVDFSVSMPYSMPPTITCDAADVNWHDVDVSISCTAFAVCDGLADSADASFLLWTGVPSDTETDNAETDTREVCDIYGNCATAGPIGGNKVDKKAPVITIVDNKDDNSYHVVTGANDAVIDGFTITGGYANGIEDPDNNGGGMYNYGSSPTVTNCTFVSNYAGDYGGGMYNEDSSPTITNSTFESNQGILSGGMYNYDSSPTVTNCTFVANTSGDGYGGMTNVSSSSPTVTNCILWNNSGNQQISNEESTPVITYSNVEDGCTIGDGCTSDDTGNIDSDPLFTNADDGNYRLTCTDPATNCSPCIDQGSDAVAPLNDKDGIARNDIGNVANGSGGYSDMGAYEFNKEPLCGDNVVDPGESCDDGNIFGEDGCSETCDCEQALGVESACPSVSCKQIHIDSPELADGIYWIDPEETWNPFQTYCDMTRHGGGWTLVVNIQGDTDTHAGNVDALGNMGDTAQVAKLSDAMINMLTTENKWLYECGPDKMAFVTNAAVNWTSMYSNSESWEIDLDLDGTFDCSANRDLFVFSDYAQCDDDADHTNYAAAGNNGCYHAPYSWGQDGKLWAK